MTIAAGFRVANGVLLGADTRVEEYNVKYDENKIFDCSDSNNGSWGVLLAGAGSFESVSYCADLVKEFGFYGATDDIRSLKERLWKFIATKRYRRLIERQPPAGDFAAIIALRSGKEETDLLYLSGESLYPIPEYRCIGAGSDTALFVSKWLYRREYPIEIFKPMAIQVFRAAKGHNVGCDGGTKIVTLYNAGSGFDAPKLSLWADTEYLWGLNELFGKIIQGCVDPRVTEDEFGIRLQGLADKARAIRDSTERSSVPMSIAVKQALESTKADLSRQQPWPE
jgi:20S proteasome alpha/beta subunit